MFKKGSHSMTKTIMSSIGGIAIATATASTAALASPSLTPKTADYNFIADSKYTGTATRSLTKSGNTWQYTVDAKAGGIATAKQRSTFKMSGNRVIPLTASTSYKVLGLGRTHDLSFGADGTTVKSTYRGKTYNFSAPNRAFDDLSLEAQIRQDLLAGSFTGDYTMVKKDNIEKTPFKKVGNYSITVPAGTFDTVRVDRIHDDNARSTSFWLAPSLDYLPVKVVQNNDGKQMEMTLTKLR